MMSRSVARWAVVLTALAILALPGTVSCSQPVEARVDEEDWVEARLEAYATLFNITPKAEKLSMR